MCKMIKRFIGDRHWVGYSHRCVWDAARFHPRQSQSRSSTFMLWSMLPRCCPSNANADHSSSNADAPRRATTEPAMIRLCGTDT